MSDEARSSALPRELVLASAGSGKTYHLSSRILGLLADGVAPAEILASTFTRKAAGEILDRVLLRLAKGAVDPEAAAELGRDAHPLLTDRAECGRLLGSVLDQLHQMNVGTLDAFFVRVARTFFQELGLAPGWTISDGPMEERIRTEAVLAALAGADQRQTAELMRLLNRGNAARQVHESLADKLDDLLRMRRQVDPEAPNVWSPDFGLPANEDPAQIAAEAAEMAGRLRALPVPNNANGTPKQSWVKAQNKAAEALETGGWDKLFSSGIGGSILNGASEFDRKPIDGAYTDLFLEAQQLGRRALAGPFRRQIEAMGRLGELLNEAFEQAQRRAAAYRFEDITHLLGGPDPAAGRVDLHYRLDQQVRHLLLDEFQDTSLEQWQALEPLAGELLSGHLDERAGVVVADPKQSIYGWRGARPELVHAVGRQYHLAEETLDRSWRSSQVVLDFVADVFRALSSNPVVADIDVGPRVAEAWMRDFTELTAAKDRPGHVRIHVGPSVKGRGAVQPDLLRHAAGVVRDLHDAMPGRTIGVLVRQNRVLSYLMAELGSLGVPASGEGGSPLTDTPPVNAILSLLHLADHPKDTVARYHVARTPVGAVVEFSDWQDDTAARRLSGQVRRALIRDGYGPTLAGWTAALAPAWGRREVQRLLQLVELGHRWDDRATLRPGDFIRYVGTEVVEDPSAARVQVMTIHKAKGLEFDVVVLPELYSSLTPKSRGIATLLRDPQTGRVVKVYPSLRKELLLYFPEVAEARDQGHSAEFRDALSVLYVAITRARHALHLVIPPDEGQAKSAARLVCHALGSEAPEEGAPEVIPDRGDPEWHRQLPAQVTEKAPTATRLPRDPNAPLLSPSPSGTKRNLSRRSPSSMEGGDRVDLPFLLRLDTVGALDRGEVVHAWCEAMEWIEGALPGAAVLVDQARAVAPRMDARAVAGLDAEFRGWMVREPIRAVLSRSAYPTGADVTVRVENERPFLRRKGDEIQEGFIDRLVLVEREGRVVEAHILDFKTDAIEPGDEAAVEERTRHYRPQIEAYCEMIREQYGLSAQAARGTLLFLAAERVVEVG